MGRTTTAKILEGHGVTGDAKPGDRVELVPDQIAFEEVSAAVILRLFEGLESERVGKIDTVCYAATWSGHLTPREAETRRYVQSVCARYGIHFSCPGNGSPDMVHLEHFAAPGGILLSSSTQVGAAGALGMAGIVGTASQIAVALAGRPVAVRVPRCVRVTLQGTLPAGSTEIDILLELVRRLPGAGAQGRALEYAGEGVSTIPLPQRAALAAGGFLVGAFTSLFPQDSASRDFLRAAGRTKDARSVQADADARHDETLAIDLSGVAALVARVSDTLSVERVSDLDGTPVHQVVLGGLPGGTFRDLQRAAAVLEGRRVHPQVDLTIVPASRRVLRQALDSGALATLLEAGARITEPGAGPASGAWDPPPASGTSLRTACADARAGTAGHVLIAGTVTAALAAREGCLRDPSVGAPLPAFSGKEPPAPDTDPTRILPPARSGEGTPVHRPPGLDPLRGPAPAGGTQRASVLWKGSDRVPAAAPAPETHEARPDPLSRAAAALLGSDREFAARARAAGGGLIVAGREFGTGPDSEMHALALRAAGVRAVLAKSFVAPQRTQLAMAGVLPLTFVEGRDADTVSIGDELELLEMRDRAERREAVVVANRTRGREFQVRLDLDDYEARIALDGGLMRHTHGVLHPAPRKAEPRAAAKRSASRPARPAARKPRPKPARKARRK